MSRFEYTIENVLDIPLWEKMQDRLAELTGTAIVCIDIKGKPVTKHSGRTAFCSIVRENPVSASVASAAMRWQEWRQCAGAAPTSTCATAASWT